MNSMLVETNGLGMRYATQGGKLALDGASFSLAPGEFLVILGQNGCGKSTLLKCIAGLLRPTAGHIRVVGRDITALTGRALAAARMALGMVFQQARLIGRRSVLSNVLCGTLGRHRGVASSLGFLPRDETGHALRCLDQVALKALARRRVGGCPQTPPPASEPAHSRGDRHNASRSRAPWRTAPPLCWPTSRSR